MRRPFLDACSRLHAVLIFIKIHCFQIFKHFVLILFRVLFAALCHPGTLSPACGEPAARICCYLQHFVDPLMALWGNLASNGASRLDGVLKRARRLGEEPDLDPKRPIQ